MIEQALTEEGGVKYLREHAKKNPVAFMGLVGKIIPQKIEAEITIFDRMTIDEQRTLLAAIASISADAGRIGDGAADEDREDISGTENLLTLS